jgi:hypothetical protein
MKDFLAVVLTCSILCTSLLSGCAGRQANPCSAYQPGDDKRSCEGLKSEYSSNENNIKTLQQEENSKTWWNIGCFVTGFLVIVPWFLMDLKDSQKIEGNAFKQRNSNIMAMAGDKGCDFLGTSTPAVAPAK